MPSQYYREVRPLRRNLGTNDVQRGMQIGQEVGKMLGGLSAAIKGAQKDALANKMMTDADISSQPGAGQTQDLGTLPSDGTGGGAGSSDDQLQQAMAASQLSSSSGQSQDLGQLPMQEPMTPGPSGAQAMPGPQASDQQLQQAMAASQLGGGPTVGSISPPGGPQPNAAAPASPRQSGDFTLNPSDYSGPGKTVGGLIHTGGTQELELQKEMLAMQGTKNAQAEAALRLTNAQAQASGTGRYALDAQIKRAQLAAAQARLNPKAAKVDKNAPPTNFTEEPVTDDAQLNNFVNKQYGNGTSEAITNLVSDGSQEAAAVKDAQGNPVIDPVTKQPKIATNILVPLGQNKSANIGLQDLKTIVRQKNVLRKKQGLSLFRVPGEDQSLGSKENPFPVATKLDAYSRAKGTWVRSPDGQIAQVP